MIQFRVTDKKLKTAKGEQTFHFARAVYNGVTTMDHLQRQIARISAISEGDVRSILLTLSQLITDELTAGRIVELGDLGRMKVGLRSRSAESKDKFRVQDIKKVRVIFTPGQLIKQGLYSASLHSMHEMSFCPLKDSASSSSTDTKKPSTDTSKDPSTGASDKDKKDYTGL